MNKLVINGQTADLSSQTIVAMTIQANNVGNLQGPQTNFSNIFKIPLTNKNRIILENLNNVNSSTNLPYEQSSGSYSQNGVNLVDDGIVTIEGVDENINVRLNGGNIDFFTLLGELVVSRLYDGGTYGELHQWSLTNMFDSRTNTEGYIYPFIDWNTDSLIFASNELNVRSMLPTLFIHSIFDKISLATGFNFSGSFIESEIFSKLILSPDTFKYTAEIVQLIADTFFTDNSPDGFVLLGNVPANAGTFTYNFPYNSLNAQASFDDGFNTFVPSMDGILILEYDLRPYISKDSSPIITPSTRKSFLIEIIDSTTSTVLESLYLFDEDTTDDLSDFEGNNDFQGSISYSGGLIQDHAYKIRYTFRIQEDNSTGYNYGFDDSGTFTLTFQATPNIKFGGIVFLNSMFNIKQKDLVKDLLCQFGVIVQTDNSTKKVKFNFFNDLIKNIPYAKDWSNKVDANSINLNFTFGKYAKQNDFKYKENETVTVGFGDSFFNISDENLEEQTTVVQLVTSATESILEDTLTFPNIKSFEYDFPTSIFTGQNNRILVLNPTISDDPITWNDFEGNTEIDTTLPLCEFDSLDFDNLLPEYYEALQNILNKTKGVQLNLKLNEIDINTLDFTIPIYLNVQIKKIHLQGMFYLNKIMEYIGKGFTKCELFRI